MCGTPVVAFNMGSAIDLVINGKTGYKAELGDVADLAYGIDYLLSMNTDEYSKMSAACRSLALELYSTDVFKKQMNALVHNDIK